MNVMLFIFQRNYEEEFEKWYKKVEEFVSKLEEKKGRLLLFL